ncbi:MAG: aminoacyl-tRNA hydrolase, partial [Lentisphaerae bacterium]|nr:aminoacyl-tRNA hydrolase [Lentisphaerota bacterium]
LLVGLGNPEPRYAGTPHNVGFEVVDCLAEQLQVELPARRRFQARLAQTVWQGRKLWLAQPLTYMNNSGQAVARLMRAGGIRPADMVVVLDDIDLPLGRIRIRPAGSDAGHRGLRSVCQSIGSDEFVRVRLGVGRPGSARVVDHVLTTFPPPARPLAKRMVRIAADAVLRIMDGGGAAAMNEYNNRREQAES